MEFNILPAVTEARREIVHLNEQACQCRFLRRLSSSENSCLTVQEWFLTISVHTRVPGNRIVKKMREKLFGSIIKQDIAFFDKTKTGELINRLSTDTSLVGQSVTMNISDGLRSVTQALGGISMMVGIMMYQSCSIITIVNCLNA